MTTDQETQIADLQRRNTELVEQRRAASIRYHVEHFHRVFELPVLDRPQVPSEDRVRLRLRLITEEFLELLMAATKPWSSEPWLLESVEQKLKTYLLEAPIFVDLPEFVDAMCDLDYVVEGTRLEFGIDGAPVLAEVHRANMAKLHDGKPLVREDGKVIKPDGWTPPDIMGVLAGPR